MQIDFTFMRHNWCSMFIKVISLCFNLLKTCIDSINVSLSLYSHSYCQSINLLLRCAILLLQIFVMKCDKISKILHVKSSANYCNSFLLSPALSFLPTHYIALQSFFIISSNIALFIYSCKICPSFAHHICQSCPAFTGR